MIYPIRNMSDVEQLLNLLHKASKIYGFTITNIETKEFYDPRQDKEFVHFIAHTESKYEHLIIGLHGEIPNTIQITALRIGAMRNG